METFRNYINGEWVEGTTFENRPANVDDGRSVRSRLAIDVEAAERRGWLARGRASQRG
jgi:hypothetical protein